MLNQPIFTPSTKARIGSKDENISIEKMYDIIGKNLADRVISKSLLLYEYAYDYDFDYDCDRDLDCVYE